jgi:hypothetical protein
VSDAFGEEIALWEDVGTSRRSFPEANPSPDKTFGFALILREGERPETSFQILANSLR